MSARETAAQPVHYRDRDNKPIDLMTWARLWEDMTYRVVAEFRRGDDVLRTMWEGVATTGHLFYIGISSDGGASFRTVAHADTEVQALGLHRRILAGQHRVTDPRTVSPRSE